MKDVKNIYEKKLLPIGYQAYSGSYHSLGKGHSWPMQDKITPFYFIPKFDEDKRSRKEAFAEVFGALHGGGAWLDSEFIRETLFPHAAQHIKQKVLPVIQAHYAKAA